MANAEHLTILNHGVDVWNKWRIDHRAIDPDLSDAELQNMPLKRVDFRDANLTGADLRNADLCEAEFCHSNLSNANLVDARLFRTDFFQADLSCADLTNADLEYAVLVETNLDRAIIEGCQIYGISVWNLRGKPVGPSNLIIRCKEEPTITVDNLEVAQFIHMLLKNEKIRGAIDSIAAKVVLLLGRFTEERKSILQSISEHLRNRDYTPIIFDFEKPAHRNTGETILSLAHMARFIIADLTEAKSVLLELQRIVPNLPSVPVQPILQSYDSEFGMIDSMRPYPWFLDLVRYESEEHLAGCLEQDVIHTAEQKLPT